MAEVLVAATRCGSLAGLEGALKLHGGHLNQLSNGEVGALHVAVWRNHIPLLEALLDAGASPDLQDKESGWTALHRALYWGHLYVATKLVEAGASLTVQDWKGRTPLDLLSAELKSHLAPAATADVYSWGNGANYQLGTGSTGLQPGPVRLDALHKAEVVALAAGKFHSVALTRGGALYTWGFGRGGRLGHPDFHVHSGEGAVIVPQLVAGFGRRCITAVAAAKHHTAAVTDTGELWTWGSNRDGRLGYPAVDTQAVPRRVSTLRARVVSVAAANKHTVAITDGGAVYSWGSNREGQLGYGTSDSASNATPRLVEAVKGKVMTAAAAAKRHTVVLSVEGEVYTWGHRTVTPRRIQLAGACDTARLGGEAAVFHKGQAEVARPRAIKVAAGAAHSCACLAGGGLLAWRSADPELAVQEVGGALAGKKVVDVSAGKYRTAAVTDSGDIYMWEGWSKPMDPAVAASLGTPTGAAHRSGAFREAAFRDAGSPQVGGFGGSSLGREGAGLLGSSPEGESPLLLHRKKAKARRLVQRIVPERVEGLKRVTHIAVGEKHSLALQCWAASASAAAPATAAAAAGCFGRRGADANGSDDDAGSLDADVSNSREDRGAGGLPLSNLFITPDRASSLGVPSLQHICELTVAQELVEPRTALSILAYADVAGAEALRCHCMAVTLANLDAVLLEAKGLLEQLPPHLLLEMEHLLQTHLGAAGPAATLAAGAAAPATDETLEFLPGTRPTAAPAELGGGLEPGEASPARLRFAAHAAPASAPASPSPPLLGLAGRERSFKDDKGATEDAAVARQVRHLRKKMQQIEHLERRAAEGGALDPQQSAKVGQRAAITSALAALLAGMPLPLVQQMLKPVEASTPSSDSKWSQSEGSGLRHGRGSAERAAVPEDAVGGERAERGCHSSCNLTNLQAPADAPLPIREPTAGNALEPTPSLPLPPLGDAAPPPSPKWTAVSVTRGFHPRKPVDAPAEASSSSALPASCSEPAPPTATGWPDLGRSSAAAATSTDAPAVQAKKPPAKSARKGGLSLFLQGALERPATSPPPPPRRPALTTGSSPWAPLPTAAPAERPTLAGIQQAEAEAAAAAGGAFAPPQQERALPLSSRSAASIDSFDSAGVRVALTQLMAKTAPITVSGKPVVAAAVPVEAVPAWAGARGASPPPTAAAPSLRDIQAEQQQRRESLGRSFGASPGASSFAAQHAATWRPPSPSAGAMAASPGVLFPAGTSPPVNRRSAPAALAAGNKWFIAEEHEVIPLAAIQSEEAVRADEEAARQIAEAAKLEEVRIRRRDARARRRRQQRDAPPRAEASGEAQPPLGSHQGPGQQRASRRDGGGKPGRAAPPGDAPAGGGGSGGQRRRQHQHSDKQHLGEQTGSVQHLNPIGQPAAVALQFASDQAAAASGAELGQLPHRPPGNGREGSHSSRQRSSGGGRGRGRREAGSRAAPGSAADGPQPTGHVPVAEPAMVVPPEARRHELQEQAGGDTAYQARREALGQGNDGKALGRPPECPASHAGRGAATHADWVIV